MTRTYHPILHVVLCVSCLVRGLYCQASGHDTKLNSESLAGKSFRFLWKSDHGEGSNGIARLNLDGTIAGINSPNESTWKIDRTGRLCFFHADGRLTTTFETVSRTEGRRRLEGPFHLKVGITHVLVEIDSSVSDDETIRPSDTARITYSQQRFIYLDVGEAATYRLKNGEEKHIQLLSAKEHTDTVIHLIRRADVCVAIDGKPLDLVCAPYAMPSEVSGLRIQADTTSAWTNLGKRVQFSVWDATDPIVATRLFVFPLPEYRLFALGTQAYNEPVHLGHRDGDPGGQRFYHNYGVDLAAYEEREPVVCCIDATVLHVDRERGTIVFEDDCGFIVEYGHLDSIHASVRTAVRVTRGQHVGYVGRRGASGNFSHLHVGTYLSREHLDSARNCRALNLYPWLVSAYLARWPTHLLAVARPHHTVRVGESVCFDGTRSLARGARIVSTQWKFHDGQVVDGWRAERTFSAPGQYTAEFWIENERGEVDVDFCKIKVFSPGGPESVIPALFATYFPTRLSHATQPVTFRIWQQGGEADWIVLDYGDGTRVDDYESYTEVHHRFAKPGIHIVTATAQFDGIPVTRKVKVVVPHAALAPKE